jgi:transcriptional regulator with XRE-family HTH domain
MLELELGTYAASEIGKQLRDERNSRGLTVIQVAKVLKVKRQMIYNHESGRCLPALDVLVRAATAWHIPFRLAGCEVVPKEGERKKPHQPPPVQQVFPFNRHREYKNASVQIRQQGQEIVITARLCTGL